MWLPDAVLTCIETLQKAGYQGYAVGGCVRDWLCGLTPKDYDVTTAATPQPVSYTHLDVYKRQGLIRSFKYIWVLR